MREIKFLIFMILVAALAAHAPGAALAAAPPLPGIEGPGGVPHYFGPYGNWAFSKLPRGPVASATLVDGGSGYSARTRARIIDAYGTGSGAAAITLTIDPTTGTITALSGGLGGTGYSAPVVVIRDPAGTGTGAVADAVIGAATLGGPLTGGMLKFIDKLPGLTPAGANTLHTPGRPGGQYIPVAVAEPVTFSGQAADYYEIGLVEFYEKMHSNLPPTKHRGYVQLSTTAVPGKRVPLTHLDGTPIFYPGTTTQVTAVDYPHYLGPVIVAQGRVVGIPNALPTDPGYPKPVRIKFYNLLPTGAGGDLFIPVDKTVMGAGMGPDGMTEYTQNRATVHLHGNNTVWISDGTPHQWTTPAGETTPYPKGVSVRNVPDMPPAGDGALTFFYTNAQSARLQFYHDHAFGITRLNVFAGEAAGYVITDAVEQDMINGTNVSGVNPGLLKVLPDIGIPLVIQDTTFVDAATIFVQDPTWNGGTGPRGATGNITAAVTGDLWYPHVYMPVQNPWDLTGTNAFGRWHYGPWFIQSTPVCGPNGLFQGEPGCIKVGPVPNPYCLPTPPTTCVVNGLTNPGVEGVDYNCSAAPWEPPCMPGTPNPSMPGESFMDTPIVNGTAYPYIEVEPKAYRFRILNAANDRMFNLQLYVAADKTAPTTADTNYNLTPARLCNGVSGALVENCTEVKMVKISVAPANQYADTPSGIPAPGTKGPDWIQIGTEGGFIPKPVVVPQQPIGWNVDPAYFSFGLVNQHSLFLGSAERADVIVDFSAYAGKTLILYNDSPAPVPAAVPQYDYYTGNGNQMDTGGAPNTQPGYGPNTRTIMQIRVGTTVTTPTTDVNLANLNTVFAKTALKRGVFEVSQHQIVIPQAAYNSAYNATFPATASQYVQIAATQKTFQPIDKNGVLQPAVTIPLKQKAMHDEMGGVYDTQFGRMSGMLGLANVNAPLPIMYGYASPPVELVKGSVEGTQIGVLPDGTQIWRIFHNGVDTHTIHTHLFHTQLINRVDQSGQVTGGTLPVDLTELGWKDTFRINPLEVTFLALRPILPNPEQVPFEVPNSVRLIDPTMPRGAPLVAPPPAGWFDPQENPIDQILNHAVNFGWEYVWHCHILSHEEMDMMHALVFAVPPKAPSGLTATAVRPTAVNLAWTDNSITETGFTIKRATNSAFTTGLTTIPVGKNVTVYSDTSVRTGVRYFYKVFATNRVGDTWTYPFDPTMPPARFPTMTVESARSNVVSVTTP